MGTDTIKLPKGFQLDVTPPEGFILDVTPPDGFELDEQQKLEAPSTISAEPLTEIEITEQQELEQRNALYKYMRENPEAIRKIQHQNENKVIQDYFAGLPETRTPYEVRERQSRSTLALEGPDESYWRKTYLAKAKRAQIKKLQEQGLIPDERREYEGFWDELGRNTVGGSLNVASGLTGTLASMSEGAVWGPDKLEQWARKLHKESSKPAYTAAKGGGWKGFVAASIGQAAPYMAAATASVLVTGQPYAAFGVGFSVEGDNAYRDALDAGATEEQAQMNRLIVGTINGVIEQIQVSQIFKFAKAGKGSVREVAKLAQQKAMKRIAQKGGKLTLEALQHSAREALEEALQETTSIAAEARINPEAWNNATDRILQSAMGGAVVGLGLGGGGRIMSRLYKKAKGTFPGEGTKAQIKEKLAEAENDVVKEIKSQEQTIKDDGARQLARQHIASQIEYEKYIYDELLQRHFKGDKKATEDLNNLVQEFHLPTYEAYLQKINEASEYYAEYVQENMMGKGPVKPKSIKSFIAPKEGMVERQIPPTETGAPEMPRPGGRASTRGRQAPELAPETISPTKVAEIPQIPAKAEPEKPPAKITSGFPPVEFEFTGRWARLDRRARHIPGPTAKGQVRKTRKFKVPIYRSVEGEEILYMAAEIEITKPTKPPTEAKPITKKTIEELQAEIDSYTKAQKNPPTELLAEFNAATRKQKGTKLTMGFDPGLEEFIAEDVKPIIAKAKEAGKAIKEIGVAVPKLFMKLVEPAKAAESVSREAYTATIKAIHRGTDVAQVEWEAQRIESMDMNMDQLKGWFGQFSEQENKDFFIAYAGKPGSVEAEMIQREAREKLPDALKQEKLTQAIREISEKNHKYLKEVMGDNVGWVQDYFYGLYKNPDMVFAKWKKSTQRFTKHKTIPSLADVINYGSEPLHNNYIDNLRAEYMGIARLGAMKWLRSELMRTGEGKYIDNMMDAPVDWQKVNDPVFKPDLLKPELAMLINNLISTNKITQQPVLNAFRKIGNFLRIVKFIGSIFHLRTELQQTIADSGYLGFLHKRTATRGFTPATKKQWARLRQTPEYKRLLELGIGHRYSYEQQAQKQFKDFVDKINRGNFIGATIRGLKIPLRIPVKFTGWLFEQYIPRIKALKVLDAQREIEQKKGRPATDWEIINIIKETQNFYGEMNERLFGRSGTVTTAMRFIYLAPGFAEGNYRTILKSLLQWGQGEGWRAGRSRSNMVNSPLITATIATLGTLMLTGKPPKKPDTLEDVRDLFKIDIGKKDPRGRKIMIDIMTYDKDYWNIYFNVLRGRPDVAAYESLRRLGGMKAPLFDMMLDFARMSTGQAIYDWKGDRVTEITDSSLEKLMKLASHEIKKTEPIPLSVYKQARKKETDVIISFVEAVMGVRPTLTEKDKREGEILRRAWSLKGQKEEMYQSLATLDRPRAGIKWYNNKVKDVLDSKLVPKSMKDEWMPKLTIDLEKYLQGKASEASRLPTNKESAEQIERAVKILKNFDISPNAAEQLLTDYYNRPKTKTIVSPIESDRILGRALKKKRLKERMR